MKLGFDIGSTTIKCILFNDEKEIIYKNYRRHYSKINEALYEELQAISNQVENILDSKMEVAISGSAGMGYAEVIQLPFVQEVYATKVAVNEYLNEADVVIELGGEDAKILFLSDGLEVRMNGSCAGGTGAFIDQMATLLNSTPDEMNILAKDHSKIYSIASRCGVFAKSDIQPLLNQGAQKNDISASIFYAMVNQTIAGLAQGRELKGNIVYLGGPLTFLSELRNTFDKVLKCKGNCPKNALYFVALGTALMASEPILFQEMFERVKNYVASFNYISTRPLFQSEQEYEEFANRHNQSTVKTIENKNYSGNVYLGIDAGSTTVKMTVLDEEENILLSSYQSNEGSPVGIVKNFLEQFYVEYPHATIKSSAVTGYGEEMLRNALSLDFGIVETIAHFKAAKKFNPQVDFIIDIGGQDIKCFKVLNGVIDDIFLNEACSSGCGSFLQSFAEVLGYSIEDFAKIGLFAKNPVDLGSRCTVFMNSSIKQAQKEGATVDNISAGLSMSVVKNALYKVIRITSAKELGKNIVVQGGTFYNDAVLRAFELEIDGHVVRPNIAGLMGAYGAALYAKQNQKEISTILTLEQLNDFTHEVQSINCQGCNNHCALTVNTFGEGRKYIGGNRCEKPITNLTQSDQDNMYEYKRNLLQEYRMKKVEHKKGVVGIPLVLNMYELLPFWTSFFNTLGIQCEVTDFSTHRMYLKGQHTIPSDTACYPAKLVHGHIEELLTKEIDAIFYPCMTYNIDESLGDNHYNCPVVAYYPEVIQANVSEIKNISFIYDYIGIHRPKDFAKKMTKILGNTFKGIQLKDVTKAVEAGFKENNIYFDKIHCKAKQIIENAEKKNQPVIVLAGRPYHIDPEINHGIDKLILSCGAAIITEDSISHLSKKVSTTVLNQWTYHSRLYAAADVVTHQKNLNLIQLVSFGCGVDAITADEVRLLLNKGNKIYTQIKIDEITNLGAVKIRLRSLFAALKDGDKNDRSTN
ncbi:acyl-CoA dehydratase activase-related protein [Anaerorhabdus furcosa]|uniref:CoA-substrate-specific enzyme activase, putative n=1 Tax=Anaerorhabdus furcosa TaxID=118967 RepID=A0A1T4PGR3_9FIRM|nr:acyl-CoA dehydratase activase-related protein [Anaerorhabdus furcosa]SJZ90773.1 CoA-substrate-specific enzyme activase, putative [Anaerorhabdus furcosa]